jgi:hypothetical protein
MSSWYTCGNMSSNFVCFEIRKIVFAYKCINKEYILSIPSQDIVRDITDSWIFNSDISITLFLVVKQKNLVKKKSEVLYRENFTV